MEVLSQLSNLEQNLSNPKELSKTLHYIIDNVEVLAPHINIDTLLNIYEKLQQKDDVAKIKYLLSIVYFIREEFMKSIEFFDFSTKESSLYNSFVHNKIIDIYSKNKKSLNEESTKYIEKVLKEENNIGIFMETKKFDEIKSISEESHLKIIKKLMQIEQFHQLVIQLDLKKFTRYYIDALIYLECVKFKKKEYNIMKEVNEMSDDLRKKFLQNVTYNEAECLNEQYESIAKVVEDFINTLPLIDQYRSSHYVSEVYPQISSLITNNETREILNGKFLKMLHKTFIMRSHKNNLNLFSSLLRGIKKNLKQLNLALIFTNTFINLCTGNDSFYRKNESFFKSLKGWNKYISIQCFGLIHLLSNDEYLIFDEKAYKEEKKMAQIKNDQAEMKLSGGDDQNFEVQFRAAPKELKIIEILQDLLPAAIKEKKVVTDSVNSTESAALHALGFASNDDDFIFNFIESECFFGATLGISNQYYGTRNELLTLKFYEHLKKEELHFEAFAYAIGQINAKSLDIKTLVKLENLIRYTEHTRIALSCATAMCLITINDRSFPLSLNEYENSWKDYDFKDSNNLTFCDLDINALFEESKKILQEEYSNKGLENLIAYILALTKSQNAYLRLAGTKCLGTFFIKNGNVHVIDALFNLVKDNSEDVRRSAVLSLGMVVKDKDLPKMLNFLALSHCSFVRSAVSLALGLFLSASGNPEAVDLLETLLYDANPLVVQSACIGLGLLLMQSNSAISNYRRIVNKIDLISIRGTEIAAKFGGLIARGLLHLGNGNLCISYKTLHGTINYKNINNFILFFDYNYFYMLMVYLGLCAHPTVYYSILIDKEKNEEKKSVYKNIRYTLTGSATVESRRRIGAFEDVALPKKRLKKFRKRSDADTPSSPDLKPNINIQRTSSSKSYSIKSGERMTVRELVRSDKKNFSLEFIDEK